MMTLPIGMLYPIDDGGEMKWAFAPMVEVKEEEKENYPNPDGGFYQKRIDTDNPKIWDNFIDGMVYVNDTMKKESKNLNDVKLDKLPDDVKLDTLPKLKKM